MKKIPTLFERKFEEHKVVDISPIVMPELEWVLAGEGVATLKIDGACCCIINGELYKRYDAKHGKPIPVGAIKCREEADAITGHFPCWVKCLRGNPSDKWFYEAYDNTGNISVLQDGTYEAIGPHFQDNPYGLDKDCLVRHGNEIIDVERTFEGIKKYLEENYIEGIVFWKDGEPKCKIKRKDFGFSWKNKK